MSLECCSLFLSVLLILVFIIYYLIKLFKHLIETKLKEIKADYDEKIEECNTKILELENAFNFQQNFFMKYENQKNLKFEENEKMNTFRSNYLLLSFQLKIRI